MGISEHCWHILFVFLILQVLVVWPLLWPRARHRRIADVVFIVFGLQSLVRNLARKSDSGTREVTLRPPFRGFETFSSYKHLSPAQSQLYPNTFQASCTRTSNTLHHRPANTINTFSRLKPRTEFTSLRHNIQRSRNRHHTSLPTRDTDISIF